MVLGSQRCAGGGRAFRVHAEYFLVGRDSSLDDLRVSGAAVSAPGLRLAAV